MPFVFGGVLEDPGFDEKGLIPQAVLVLNYLRFNVTSPIYISCKIFSKGRACESLFPRTASKAEDGC